MAFLIRPTYRKNGVTRKTSKWYGVIKDPATGKNRRVPLCEDKTAAKVMLADLIRQQDREAAGIVPPAAAKPKRLPLSQHIDDWQQHLRAKGVTKGQQVLSRTHVSRCLAGVKWAEEITQSAVEKHLVQLAEAGRSVQTRNNYIGSVKAFCNWLVYEERLQKNPLHRLRKSNVAKDRRHDRRALTEAEFAKLLATAATSEEVVKGKTGPQRRMIYLVAASTGFRASEIASLTPGSFRLDDASPVVVGKAAYAKNGKEAVQPLPVVMVPMLRQYLADKPQDKPVWAGWWRRRASELMKVDLAAAGIEYETSDGFADFHSLRTLYITGLFRAGVHPRIAQQLARHSTIELTMQTYTRVASEEVLQAVARLAVPVEEAKRGTRRGRKATAAVPVAKNVRGRKRRD